MPVARRNTRLAHRVACNHLYNPASPAARVEPPVAPTESAASRTAAAAPLPLSRASIELMGPEKVQGGTEFALTVKIGHEAAVRSQLELSFDLGVLTLADASVRYESPSPGIARLQFDQASAQPLAASLQFVAGFSSRAPTAVRISGGEFVSSEGRAIGLAYPAPLQIVLLPHTQ